MAFNPTHNQEKAITLKGNILVSAAAGSGKTAVLVERVINLLTAKESHVNADELLIVTFTNAAAAEMRARIEKRINEECKNHPNSSYLLSQKYLLSNAKICTIDSFCIDLVRENFDKLGVAPDFKIGDKATLDEINEKTVYEIINRYITENNTDFLNLVDLVGGEYDEKKLADLILSAYEYSRQLPFPEKWYDFILNSYGGGKFESDNIWYNYAFAKAEKTVSDMQTVLANLIDQIVSIEAVYDLFMPSLNTLAENLNHLKQAVISKDWDLFYNALLLFPTPSLPVLRGGNAAYREAKAVKQAFKEFKEKSLPSLSKLFYGDFKLINSQFNHIYPCVKVFVDILKEFDQKVFEEYNLKSTFTFHNIEHLALKLLCREENGEIVVSQDGRELLDQYKAVMVDEYQDTNNLQDYLFLILSNFEEKLFVVGDVKQSIYAFRGANPTNFLMKKERYIPFENAAETDAQKIILKDNFRTKHEVCDFINYFFTLFMTKETGKIDYNGEEKLLPAAKFPKTDAIPVRYDIIDCRDANDNSWELEGRQIARYINEVMLEGKVIRQDEQSLREAAYGDFTVLLRSLTNAPYIIKALKNEGIPVDISLDSFAENREIATMLSLLRVIDNLQQDIELLSVLMSPIFSFSPDELAEIRADKKDGNLYSAIIKSALNGNEKANGFIKKLENYRIYAVSLTLPDLISKLFIETEFLNLVSAFTDGQKRRSNLLILLSLAEQFSAIGGKGLSAFAKYTERLSSSIGKSTASKSSNAVKIMTMHSSKGLQFPVTIIAGTDSRFNDEDLKHQTCYSINHGIGFKYFDIHKKQQLSTVSREVIADSTRSVSLEDELRLFYVALTRTEDRLYIVSSFKNFENSLEKYKNRLIMYGGKIKGEFFSKTHSFSDWLIPAILLHPDGKPLREAGDMLSVNVDDSQIKVNIIDGSALLQSTPNTAPTDALPNLEIAEKIRNNIQYDYPFKDILRVKSKTSVSQLANKAESDKFAFETKPSFMINGGLSGAARGSAMHKVMQYFDFSKYNDIEAELERLFEWQFITEAEYNSINKTALKQFFASEIFARLKNAQAVKREMKFLSEVSVTEIDNTLDSRFNDEKIVIQGAVDVCFIENDQLVILDFKTDRVEDLLLLETAYAEQLKLYADACSKIFGLPVKEKIIYSFSLSDYISL